MTPFKQQAGRGARLLKRVHKVPKTTVGTVTPRLYEEAPDHVAQVHFITGMKYVYIRKVTDTYIHFVVMKSKATTEKMHRNEWENRVQDATIRPATEKDLERFQRITSAWRNAVTDKPEHIRRRS